MVNLRQQQTRGRLHPRIFAGPSDDSQNGCSEVGERATHDVEVGRSKLSYSGDFSGVNQWDSATVSSEPLVTNYYTVTKTTLAANGFGLFKRPVAAVISAFQLEIGMAFSSKILTLLVDSRKVWR